MSGFPGHSFDGTTLIEDDEKILFKHIKPVYAIHIDQIYQKYNIEISPEKIKGLAGNPRGIDASNSSSYT